MANAPFPQDVTDPRPSQQICSHGPAAPAVRDAPPPQDAPDQIAQWKRDSEILRCCNIVEIAVHNDTGSVGDYMKHWESRALKAEAERDALLTQHDANSPRSQAGRLDRAAANLWRALAEQAEAERDELTAHWRELGDILKSGGMYDPSFLIGMVVGVLAAEERLAALPVGLCLSLIDDALKFNDDNDGFWHRADLEAARQTLAGLKGQR